MFRPRGVASAITSAEWTCRACRQSLLRRRLSIQSRSLSTESHDRVVSTTDIPPTSPLSTSPTEKVHRAQKFVNRSKSTGKDAVKGHPQSVVNSKEAAATLGDGANESPTYSHNDDADGNVSAHANLDNANAPITEAQTEAAAEGPTLHTSHTRRSRRRRSRPRVTVSILAPPEDDGKPMSLAQAMISPRIKLVLPPPRKGSPTPTTANPSTTPPTTSSDTAPPSYRSRRKRHLDIDPSNVDDTISTEIYASQLQLTPLDVAQPPVPPLQYGLDRVLFNPGVYQLQDPNSRVYNFDDFLQHVTPVVDFNFNSLKEYKTSSHDQVLSRIAKEHKKRYIGSTSSMTATLAHFHFLLSNWRDLNLSALSKNMEKTSATFTKINRGPNAIFLRYKNGVYAIDADKEHDAPNVLMMLGKSMELLLTQPRDTYERYRKDSPRPITEEEKNVPEAYHYTTLGDFLMRSQLDAHDSRLPGTGMFDLKTRAVVSVRMNVQGYEEMTGYEILNLRGNFESYEREYYDMLRSTMLKYMLQARMGRMDGIFVAYHNTDRVFGFQYLPMSEIDESIHDQTNPCLGDQEFKASVTILNDVLNMATEKFPETSLRLHFETKAIKEDDDKAYMNVFAEPMSEDDIQMIQDKPKARIMEYEKRMMGIDKTGRDDRDSPKTGMEKSVPETRSPGKATAKADSDTPDEAETELGPLWMATVRVDNYTRITGEQPTDWEPCPQNRPSKLRANKEWKISYGIKELDDNETLKWTRYRDMKSRRREILAKTEAEETVEDEVNADVEDGKRKAVVKDQPYIAFLKRLSQNGRKHRAAMDEMDKGMAKVIVR